mgnify:CR=1 FL=1
MEMEIKMDMIEILKELKDARACKTGLNWEKRYQKKDFVDALLMPEFCNWLVWCLGNTIHLAQLLIESGADIDTKDVDGLTPLFYAVNSSRSDVGKLLIEKGADVNAVSNSNGWTPLKWAVCDGYLDIVRLLIEKGVDVNTKDNFGKTPLSWAKWGDQSDIAKFLIEKGAKE